MDTTKKYRASKSPKINYFEEGLLDSENLNLTPDGFKSKKFGDLSPKSKVTAAEYLPSKFQAQTSRFRRDLRNGAITVKNLDASKLLASPRFRETKEEDDYATSIKKAYQSVSARAMVN